jgi:hypothetical protein
LSAFLIIDSFFYYAFKKLFKEYSFILFMVKRGVNKFNISNRLLYTLILLFALLLMGAGVYAVAGGNSGHHIDTISAPSGCKTNWGLAWTGSDWTCRPVSFPTCEGADQGITWTGVNWVCVNLG